MSQEDKENENRRDDVLERDFMRGSDRNDDIFQTRERERAEDRARRLDREDIMFFDYVKDVNVSNNKRDARDGLRLRDELVHSTAVGSLEGEISAVGDALQEAVEDDEAE